MVAITIDIIAKANLHLDDRFLILILILKLLELKEIRYNAFSLFFVWFLLWVKHLAWPFFALFALFSRFFFKKLHDISWFSLVFIFFKSCPAGGVGGGVAGLYVREKFAKSKHFRRPAGRLYMYITHFMHYLHYFFQFFRKKLHDISWFLPVF